MADNNIVLESAAKSAVYTIIIQVIQSSEVDQSLKHQILVICGHDHTVTHTMSLPAVD